MMMEKNHQSEAGIQCQVGFYHLTRSPLEEALPALLERSLAVGERAVVRFTSPEERDRLDKALWASRSSLWLPHGTGKSGHAARQPIWLTDADDVPNQARFLFRINGAGGSDFTGFLRIFDLFDGHDEASVEQARLRWKAMKGAGYVMTYWKQEPKGWLKAG